MRKGAAVPGALVVDCTSASPQEGTGQNPEHLPFALLICLQIARPKLFD
jgi:hypothetical protein